MKISKVRDVKTPTRGTSKAAGIDFYVPNDFEEVIVFPGKSIRILSGIKVRVPEGYALIAFNKSGVALSGLDVGACVVDEDYQGEMSLHLFNPTDLSIIISPGKKLLQMILLKMNYEEVEEVPLEELYPEVSERGEGGFGSTGLH